jgi:hypothetical protein
MQSDMLTLDVNNILFQQQINGIKTNKEVNSILKE